MARAPGARGAFGDSRADEEWTEWLGDGAESAAKDKLARASVKGGNGSAEAKVNVIVLIPAGLAQQKTTVLPLGLWP